MKKILSLTASLILIISFAAVVSAQKKTARKSVNTNVPAKPKVEIEDWQEFDSKKLKLKLEFPKKPTINERKDVELRTVEVLSTTLQADINGAFYLLEVREYPKGTLPDRDDLGESYGTYLANYILTGSKILKQTPIEFGKSKGLEFIYQDTSTALIIHRVFVVGQKLLQLMVHLKIKKPETYQQTIDKNKEKIDKFFDSLQMYEEQIIDGTVAKK